MDGDFTLGKPGWYKPLNVEENEFLNNKLETDQYGIFYSVRFDGDAETFLWQAKTKPVEGEKIWGHIEESKSGKSMRFKKDKDAPTNTPDGKPSAATVAQQEHGDAITASMCVKLAFQQFCHVETMLPRTEEHWAYIEYMSDMLYMTIKKTGNREITVEKVKQVFAEPLPEEPEDLEETEPAREWSRVGKGKYAKSQDEDQDL